MKQGPNQQLSHIGEENMPIINGFLDAHQKVIAKARNEYAADPAQAEVAYGKVLVGVSNEEHAAELVLDSRDVAGKGLKRWLRKLRRRPPRFVSFDMQADAEQEPLGLVFGCVPDGRYMYDPLIHGKVLDTERVEPKTGGLEDTLNAAVTNLNRQFEEPEFLTASPTNDFRLRTNVEAFIALANDPHARVELGPPAADSFYGDRAIAFAKVANKVREQFPEMQSKEEPQDLGLRFGWRTLETLPDRNGQYVTVSVSRHGGTRVELHVGTQSTTLPEKVQLECFPDTANAKDAFVRILDERGRSLTLGRADRTLVHGMAIDAMTSGQLIEQPRESDLFKPSQTVLDVCKNAIETSQHGEFAFEYTTQEGQVWKGYMHKDEHTESGFVLLLQSAQSGNVMVHTFSAAGTGMSQVPKSEILRMYEALENL